jgi:two-component system CheB/CheR fusion protein
VDPQEQEVRDRDGRWYSLRIRPYKGVDNRLDGAVVAAIGIDESRRFQNQMERSRDYFAKIVEMVNQPLVVLDGDLRVRSANSAFCQTVETTRAKVEGTLIYELANGRWNNAELKKILAAASSDEATHHIRIDHGHASPGARQITLKVRGFQLEDASQWILMAMESPDGQDARQA